MPKKAKNQQFRTVKKSSLFLTLLKKVATFFHTVEKSRTFFHSVKKSKIRNFPKFSEIFRNGEIRRDFVKFFTFESVMKTFTFFASALKQVEKAP